MTTSLPLQTLNNISSSADCSYKLPAMAPPAAPKLR